MTMNHQNPPLISAEAILRSRTGRSLARADEPVTAENIEEFSPSKETVTEATWRFEELGFVVSQSGVTLTLLGEPSLFEKVFGVSLTVEEGEQTRGITVRPEGDPVVPDSLKDVVEEVVFPEQPEFFPSSAQGPQQCT
jgi:hypothetical protein